MSRGHYGDLLNVSVTCTNTSVAANDCGHVETESHETEVPFPHFPKFRISDHKEFLKSNAVWMCDWSFPLCGNLPCVKLLHFKSRWKILRRKRVVCVCSCVCWSYGPSGLRLINIYRSKHPPALMCNTNFLVISQICHIIFNLVFYCESSVFYHEI